MDFKQASCPTKNKKPNLTLKPSYLSCYCSSATLSAQPVYLNVKTVRSLLKYFHNTGYNKDLWCCKSSITWLCFLNQTPTENWSQGPVTLKQCVWCVNVFQGACSRILGTAVHSLSSISGNNISNNFLKAASQRNYKTHCMLGPHLETYPLGEFLLCGVFPFEKI